MISFYFIYESVMHLCIFKKNLFNIWKNHRYIFIENPTNPNKKSPSCPEACQKQ